jgi:predicted nuclease of predicted toxin-antitoxin system
LPSFLIWSPTICRRPSATPHASSITAQFTPIQAVPVRDLGLRDADGRVIFAQARSAGAVVITKDRDFLHLLFEQGPPPQVIWLRVGNSSNQALQAMLLRTPEPALATLPAGHYQGSRCVSATLAKA